ncbi:hypothetical protein JCM24511_02133 [Saitozyma sp. JCM 24511]|nr:hypothetical protein JCM24511_02133 [Saitozyma sp. JCM 24511]
MSPDRQVFAPRGSSKPVRSYGATDPSTAVVADEPTPLPVGQMILLCMTRLAEPISFTILLPFVQQMIVLTGEVEVKNVGYATGLVGASFSFTQVIFRELGQSILRPWCVPNIVAQ